MEKIESSRKFQNGIQVLWTEKGEERSAFFSYEELVDRKINALDLLDNPKNYRVDPGKNLIESSV